MKSSHSNSKLRERENVIMSVTRINEFSSERKRNKKKTDFISDRSHSAMPISVSDNLCQEIAKNRTRSQLGLVCSRIVPKQNAWRMNFPSTINVTYDPINNTIRLIHTSPIQLLTFNPTRQRHQSENFRLIPLCIYVYFIFNVPHRASHPPHPIAHNQSIY